MASRISTLSMEQEIHRFVTREQIELLHSHFQTHNDRLTLSELRDVLSHIGLRYTDDQFRGLCLQINTDHDAYCQWDEFLNYLILGFQDDDPLAVKQSLDPPIADELGLKLSRQVYTIVKVDFCPMVYYDGSISWTQGHWITTSREGVIHFWTNDWKPSMAGRSVPSSLKRSKTWILDTVPLPDQSMLCVASLECELRFYAIVAASFTLKLVIDKLPHPVTCMVYQFLENERSALLFGDYEGNIRAFYFYPERKVTSTSISFTTVVRVSLTDVLRGKYRPLECVDFGPLLPDIVRSVQFVGSLNSFIAVSENNPLKNSRVDQVQSKRKGNMIIQSLETPSEQRMFFVPQGVTCFAYEPTTELLVSGGPDCDLRLWDIHRPEKPTVALVGHTASITFLFVQDAGEKIYSMDQKKIIKVWDVRNRLLLQTFSQFSTVLAKGLPACGYYNQRDRELVVASNKLFVVACCPAIALDRTDGDSHTKPVSVLLYNSLYKLIVSCAFDSFIIVWDHKMNRKMTIISEAHTQPKNGVQLPVEITAACFDEKQQLLLTGARDGSLKIWNISARTCVRSFHMEEDSEVTAVFWQGNRILAMGWNHRVVEFAAFSEKDDYPRGLQWRKLHSDDILCAAVSGSLPGVMATCSYTGELVLWMLETGQPYRRYDATNPRSRIPIQLHPGESGAQKARKIAPRRSIFQLSADRFLQRRLSRIVMPSGLEQMRLLSIQALLFLSTRPMLPSFGTLLGSLDNGIVQVWSHHPEGGFVGQFNAVHMAGDRVLAMTSDAANRFLFTGTALGYIKTWYIENCWSGETGHRSCITGLVYLDGSELLLSASSDRTIRLWTLGGRYIGLLGSPVHWEPLSASLPPSGGYRFRVPPDLQREVSFTTLKVLHGGNDDHGQRLKTTITRGVAKEHSNRTRPMQTYGESLGEPILNTGVLKLPSKEPILRDIKLERFFPRVPVYGHMVDFPVKPLVYDRTVESILERTKPTKFMDPPNATDRGE
ncbi:WD repeat-containing protein on Y chromosome [Anopheles ziemanni]|uniref:WD repeat-containing protein on Y chromosome n=1 Tax=Anopheles coustani TaxID=139045 RepID=UPI002658732D|nr:WD repeat-containing protein on Y chromosome [Anopheles coustani]XP_058169576.1 WD repeat-containing protein on Y chromosome [Anopheles ziemanni]